MSWHSANPENGHLRSMDPADFAALVAGAAPPVEFVNLQYKARAEDLAALQDIAPVAQTGVEVFDDLCGMARLIETCVISWRRSTTRRCIWPVRFREIPLHF